MAKILAEKIAVMQAAERGEEIEIRACGCANWHLPAPDFAWNWRDYDYRVKPKPQKFWVVFKLNGTVFGIYESKPEIITSKDLILEEYERKV